MALTGPLSSPLLDQEKNIVSIMVYIHTTLTASYILIPRDKFLVSAESFTIVL